MNKSKEPKIPKVPKVSKVSKVSKQITNTIKVSQILYRKGEELKEKDYELEVYRMALQKWENILYKKEMRVIEQMTALSNKLLINKSILYGEKRGRKKEEEVGNKGKT